MTDIAEHASGPPPLEMIERLEQIEDMIDSFRDDVVSMRNGEDGHALDDAARCVAVCRSLAYAIYGRELLMAGRDMSAHLLIGEVEA